MVWSEVERPKHVALAEFSPGEVARITGLSTNLQRVWRRRGHLPARSAGYASFDARDLAALAVRHDLTRMGFAPPDTVEIGRMAAKTVLYFALLSSRGASCVQGEFVGEMIKHQAIDQALAIVITEVIDPRRYVLITDPPAWEFVDDAAAALSQERCSALLILDLALIGQRLVARNTKPLFLIDVASQ